MTDLLFLASLLPLLPLLPLIVLAVALLGELVGEVAALLAPADPFTLATLIVPCTPIDRLVVNVREERVERAIETARHRGDPALAIRASLAWQAGDYGRALAFAGAACRVGR